MIRIIAAVLLLALVTQLHANGISGSVTPQAGGGIDFNFNGGFGGRGLAPAPPPGGAGKILLVDGSSHILLVDGTSRICRAGGC